MVVIATKAHREGFEQRLKADELNLDAARLQGDETALHYLARMGYPGQ